MTFTSIAGRPIPHAGGYSRRGRPERAVARNLGWVGFSLLVHLAAAVALAFAPRVRRDPSDPLAGFPVELAVDVPSSAPGVVPAAVLPTDEAPKAVTEQEASRRPRAPVARARSEHRASRLDPASAPEPSPPPAAAASAPSVLAAEPDAASAGWTIASGERPGSSGIVSPSPPTPAASGTASSSGGSRPSAQADRSRIARAWFEAVSRVLLEQARRRYPRSALRAGHEGTVLLAIRIDPHGRIDGVSIERGSGVQALDNSAVEAVASVSSVPPPPVALGWQTRALRMPIVYRIR
ncbi:MAG: energy transducer TonB [Myxococcota bacterium]|nr:energy transducer TonB [Myxococcota bacterium]MDW8363703.1 TonB family protein [Myxococcales bacterium]